MAKYVKGFFLKLRLMHSKKLGGQVAPKVYLVFYGFSLTVCLLGGLMYRGHLARQITGIQNNIEHAQHDLRRFSLVQGMDDARSDAFLDALLTQRDQASLDFTHSMHCMKLLLKTSSPGVLMPKFVYDRPYLYLEGVARVGMIMPWVRKVRVLCPGPWSMMKLARDHPGFRIFVLKGGPWVKG